MGLKPTNSSTDNVIVHCIKKCNNKTMKKSSFILFLLVLSLLINPGCTRTSNKKSKIVESKVNFNVGDAKHGILGRQAAKEELDKFLDDTSYNLFRGEVLINDAQTLTRIVEPILFDVYGESEIIRERPYETYLFDDYWVMMGTSPEGMKGGNFEIVVNRRTCEVVGITHGK
jgi:hypothetical protein